ncbi:MAG: hypothetical protein H0U57_13610 [Tatlockia sp.]|nr:hypothetical protein [Tatlockia sp.]
MIKLILLNTMLAVGLTSTVYSAPLTGIKAEATGEPIEKIDSSKLPQTGEGVLIVEDSELANIKLPQHITFALDSQKKLGYVPRKSYAAVQLIAMKKHHFQSPGDVKFFTTNEPTDTHLKKSLSNIKLAFDYHPLSFILDKDTLGFAPAMTYLNSGWTGIVQYFNYPVVGTCKYMKSSVTLNGSAIRLSKKQISLYINKKPAQVMNEGRKEEGFAYLLHWYDNQYFHELSCATETYTPEAAKKMISLATKIDNE